jgi:decaprenylphospho-beta-D-ribofuranose 2-oxidase
MARSDISPAASRTEKLYGWGRLRPSESTVYYPDVRDQLTPIPGITAGKRVLARGKGRSYGDASLNAGNTSVCFDWLDKVHEFDTDNGVLVCEAGLTLEEIIRLILPRGWFLPVTPGTCYPSLGGSFACDVHGKNHHVNGSLGEHVEWIELVNAEGQIMRCSSQENADLFAATRGGLGLTGLIYRLCLKLERVPSAYYEAQFIKTNSLEETMTELEQGDKGFTHTVSWLDCSASGPALGRGEVTLGSYAPREKLPPKYRSRPYDSDQGLRFTVPMVSPIPLVNALTVRLFNEAYYRKRMNPRQNTVVHYGFFLYPLDMVREWNRVYNKGFVQYQFVVPFDAGRKLLPHVLRACQTSGHVPALNVLKRFGEGQPLLSFPEPGWTLALDFGASRGLMQFLEELDHAVLDHGGKVYLVKDHRLSPKMFRAMYPEFGDWLAIKQKYDPEWRFESNLSRRLRMHEGV